MITIECILARLTSQIGMPAFATGGKERVLHDVFANSSQGDIDLVVDNSALANPPSNQQGFWALELHEALAALTRNPPPPAPSRRIAVLYADFYRPFPAALGVMFDRGFDPGDDPSSATVFRRSPREGCAVFLSAIAKLRNTPAQIDAEALFTTIHELGHVFNLQHIDTPANFLSQSQAARPFPASAYRFVPLHQQALATCSRSPHVWPGGSKFDDTGPFGHLSASPKARSRQGRIELVLSMAQREFWPFEPVELDIEVRLAPGVQRPVIVPHAVDPGYDAFKIWIEEPSGERRRYRSPRRYCMGAESLRIGPRAPFRRDVSIFGEAGGYTFKANGVHHLWATFEVSPGRLIESNRLEVCVRGAIDSADYELARSVLAHSKRARVLYYRQRRGIADRQLALLRQFCTEGPALPSKASIRYAVARAALDASLRSGTRPAGSALRLLAEARDSSFLGRRQRSIADQLLAAARTA